MTEKTTQSRQNNAALIVKAVGFLFKNMHVLKMIAAHERFHSDLIRVNTEIAKMNPLDPRYARRVAELNQAVIELMKSKWYTDRAVDTQDKTYIKKASAALKRGQRIAKEMLRALESGADTPVTFESASLSSKNTEIVYADDVPMVPEINPVILLQGSDYEMGYQYAQQVVQIFGTAIMARESGKSAKFTAEDFAELRKWEDQLRQHAPELIEMARGWAAGATDAGVPMTYEDALDVWTGHIPPAHKYLGKGALPAKMPPLACSGVAAWGSSTKDGRLVTGSSGDHDCTFMVTVVAFPETGNNFIFSPFTASGTIPILGGLWMMGHPGMNNKGLAYVHHGGVPKLVEPQEEWGYGLRRGASIFHILRFANSAKEAREMELAMPVGDAGIDSAGTVGGFYADSSYAYIAESRKNPVIIREAGALGEKDFLYANNSANHPDLNQHGWMKMVKDRWVWEKRGGWRPTSYSPPSLLSPKRKDTFENLNGIMSLVYDNSYWRNHYYFEAMERGSGQIDMDYMKALYRVSGERPQGTFEEAAKRYKKTGDWGKPRTGHAGNALVSVMKPDNGEEGIYALCTGPAARGLVAHAPNPHSGPIYNETNAFFELKLAGTPQGVVNYAAQKAEEYLAQARTDFANLAQHEPAYANLKALLEKAEQHLASAKEFAAAAQNSQGRQQIFQHSRAAREYVRAQVRALQVSQALNPPAKLPGFKE